MGSVDDKLILLNDFTDLINQRTKAMNDYDDCLKRVSELKRFPSAFNNQGEIKIPSPLSQLKTPPAEITAAFQNLSHEMENIQRFDANIREYQTEIAAIKNKSFVLIFIFFIILLIIIARLVS